MGRLDTREAGHCNLGESYTLYLRFPAPLSPPLYYFYSSTFSLSLDSLLFLFPSTFVYTPPFVFLFPRCFCSSSLRRLYSIPSFTFAFFLFYPLHLDPIPLLFYLFSLPPCPLPSSPSPSSSSCCYLPCYSQPPSSTQLQFMVIFCFIFLLYSPSS